MDSGDQPSDDNLDQSEYDEKSGNDGPGQGESGAKPLDRKSSNDGTVESRSKSLDRKSSNDGLGESRAKPPAPTTKISVNINTNASSDVDLARALMQPFNRIAFPNYTNGQVQPLPLYQVQPLPPSQPPLQPVTFRRVSTTEWTEQVAMASPDPKMASPDPDMASPDPNMASPDPSMAAPDPNMAINEAPVVVSQPTTVYYFVRPPIRQWKTGLGSVCEDTHICCCSFFCFRCFACRVAKDMGESGCVPCCVPAWLIVLRTKLRASENIEGTVLRDCCTACWCPSCTLCQIAREVKALKKEQYLA